MARERRPQRLRTETERHSSRMHRSAIRAAHRSPYLTCWYSASQGASLAIMAAIECFSSNAAAMAASEYVFSNSAAMAGRVAQWSAFNMAPGSAHCLTLAIAAAHSAASAAFSAGVSSASAALRSAIVGRSPGARRARCSIRYRSASLPGGILMTAATLKRGRGVIAPFPVASLVSLLTTSNSSPCPQLESMLWRVTAHCSPLADPGPGFLTSPAPPPSGPLAPSLPASSESSSRWTLPGAVPPRAPPTAPPRRCPRPRGAVPAKDGCISP